MSNAFPSIDLSQVEAPAKLADLLRPHPNTPVFNATLRSRNDKALRSLKRAKWPDQATPNPEG